MEAAMREISFCRRRPGVLKRVLQEAAVARYASCAPEIASRPIAEPYRAPDRPIHAHARGKQLFVVH